MKRLIDYFVNLNRQTKQAIMVITDSVWIVLILLASLSIRLGQWYLPEGEFLWAIIPAPILAVPIFVHFGLYRAIIRFLGLQALWAVIKAVSLYAVIWGAFMFMLAVDGMPRSIVVINWLMALLVIGGSRMIGRWFFSGTISSNSIDKKNVVIFGTGSSARQLSSALEQSEDYRPIAFIDDSGLQEGQQINGVSVFAIGSIVAVIQKHNVREVLIALNSVSRKKHSEIVDLLAPFQVQVKILPSMTDLADGKIKIDDLRKVKIEDLLGREPVQPNQKLLHLNIIDKVVLVTGAGGSIGSEICRQVIKLGAKRLVLFDHSELALYNIDKELSSIQGAKVVPLLGSVVNQERVESICNTFGVQTIYHAAAYKHVPLVESNNTEGVINNIIGTLYSAQAAINCGVETFVLISTDKAVRPTNIMGATKRCAEQVLQALSGTQDKTNFCMVRFGNVLGSSGSVIPLFEDQINNGGPVTVTDKEIVRYFMTIPEAVELVIQAGAMNKRGDIFVLDMGKPVNIYQLAEKMIHLSGLEVRSENNPDGDIEIKLTGLRPGEKLFEELLIGGNATKTSHSMIMRANEKSVNWESISKLLDNLNSAAMENNYESIKGLLVNMVPEFTPKRKLR
jgi:FlaA1/EpsC-like NDP-sugar epimerase